MVSAVLLAAGASTRMGVPKLLLPLGGEPIVRRTARQVCASGFDEVIVVSGAEHERIVEALEGLPVRHAVNPDFATGMGSSFRTGVAHLGDCEAAMFALADQPFLTSAEYGAILTTWMLHHPLIVGSRFGEVTAPPHLFARALYPELAALQHGARSVLQRHASRMIVMHFAAELLMDIDTPDDYERAKVRVAAGR
ncbi:MAG: NTP transferase domain-containing protein [Vicinamibacterales bacterium]